MLLVLLGPPGSGKGTQSARLADHLGTVHVSTGEILRKAVQESTDLGKQAASYMESGQLVPSPLVIDLVAERLAEPDCSSGCLLDGFPRSLDQAQAFLEVSRRPDHDSLLRRLQSASGRQSYPRSL